MLQIKSDTNLNFLKNDFKYGVPYLILSFYLPPFKRENIEPLIQFFQKHHLNFERIKDKARGVSFFKNGNFIVHRNSVLSETELKELNDFSSTKIIAVALFYQNEIWTRSRLQNFKSSVPLLPTTKKNVSFFGTPLQTFQKLLKTLRF